MLVWCAGVYASASTWTFNALRQLAQREGEVGSRFVNTMADTEGLEAGRHAVKSHDVPADVADHLASLATAIVVTTRDPSDAVTSLMRYQNFPFALALDWVGRSARFVAATSRRPGVLTLRYEDGFCDLPATIARLAAHAHIAADEPACAAVFASLRRGAVEAEIARFPTRTDVRIDPRSRDIDDPVTHWHRHHAGRDGAIGRWRHALTPAEANEVRATLADVAELFHPRPLPASAIGGYAAPQTPVARKG
jgi:hypothetical protein